MLPLKELLKTPEYWIEHTQDELYRQLSEYLKKAPMSQTEFAENLGVSKGYVSQVLNGRFNYTLSKLIELSLAIGKAPEITFQDLDQYITNRIGERKNANDEIIGETKIIPYDERIWRKFDQQNKEEENKTQYA